ncbi:sulfatase [Conservatibacter flavescens]|uniref:Sulfatase n=1 Tax=Conservatibacter flavescens TaxID=28161 RepID=A0A2M8RZT7_9PAST|nr:sulfatase [Conservatibacter flavescens]
MFGLLEDQTQAVLKNIYEEVPVISLFFLTSIVSILPSLLVYQAIYYNWFHANLSVITFSILASFSILSMLALARGTLFSLPLGKAHAQVSSLNIINKMIPNGIVAIEWALKDRKREISFSAVSEEEGLKLMQLALNKNSLLDTTEKNAFLEQNSPHVVFALMESFGTNILVLDEPDTNDLLGKLRPYVKNSFFFKRFLSISGGTAPTLASLFFHSPIQNISQSVAQKTALSHTPFQIYKKKGYKTIFITSGNVMWRNLGNYLPLQGVDEIYDQNSILDLYPEARNTLSYWGIADEFAFSLAEKLLQESIQPLFVSILTITNHPPYQLPKHYDARNIQPDCLKDKLGNSDQEREKVLKTYQYATNALGNFISNIDNNPNISSTIIAATGDHHLRGVNARLPEEYFLMNAVPFLIHIPENIKSKLSLHFDQNVIGSHKDVFPTLYEISLSEAEYWNLGGRNLLKASDNNFNAFAYNENVWADSTGVVCHYENYSKYLWKDDLLTNNSIDVPQEQIEKINAYKKLLFWQINYQIKGYKH